jgi:hypothetical protein
MSERESKVVRLVLATVILALIVFVMVMAMGPRMGVLPPSNIINNL